MGFDLQNVQPTVTMKPPRIIMYSTPGMGKSWFGSKIPKHIFLDCNDGLDGIPSTKFPIRPGTANGTLFYHVAEVIQALNALLNEPHNFECVVIDTLSDLEHMIWRQICSEHHVDQIEKIGWGKGYKYGLKYWQQILDLCDALRLHRGMMVFMTAHARLDSINDPTSGEGYSKYTLDIHKTVFSLIQKWSDAIVFADQKVFTTEKDTGFGRKIHKATGGQRVLYTREDPRYDAKNRYGLPNEIPLDYPQFFQTLLSSHTANYQQMAIIEAQEEAQAKALLEANNNEIAGETPPVELPQQVS